MLECHRLEALGQLQPRASLHLPFQILAGILVNARHPPLI